MYLDEQSCFVLSPTGAPSIGEFSAYAIVSQASQELELDRINELVKCAMN